MRLLTACFLCACAQNVKNHEIYESYEDSEFFHDSGEEEFESYKPDENDSGNEILSIKQAFQNFPKSIEQNGNLMFTAALRATQKPQLQLMRFNGLEIEKRDMELFTDSDPWLFALALDFEMQGTFALWMEANIEAEWTRTDTFMIVVQAQNTQATEFKRVLGDCRTMPESPLQCHWGSEFTAKPLDEGNFMELTLHMLKPKNGMPLSQKMKLHRIAEPENTFWASKQAILENSNPTLYWIENKNGSMISVSNPHPLF